MVNIYEAMAGIREILKEYKEGLPELEDKAEYFFSDPEYRDAWLITETQIQEHRKLIERLEKLIP